MEREFEKDNKINEEVVKGLEVDEKKIELIQDSESESTEIGTTQKIETNNVVEEAEESYTDKKDKAEIEFEKEMGENMKYVKALEEKGYYFGIYGFGSGMCTVVSNYLPLIEKITHIDTGDDLQCDYTVKAFLNTGEELPPITVPYNKLERTILNINPIWGLKPVLTGDGSKLDLINAMKYLKYDAEEKTIYKFIGYKDIDGKMRYFHAGGAIGMDGKITVDLEDDNLNRYKFTDKEFDLQSTFKKSLLYLEVAPKSISFPILALQFLAPLTSMINGLNLPIGFVVWIVGPQQSKKTSLANACNSHFGNFDEKHSPVNFEDSIPTMIQKIHKVGDATVTCDDFYPSTDKTVFKEMIRKSEKLISSVSDKITGSRSKSNGDMRKTYRARCQLIITGELIPQMSPSRLSRLFIIRIKKGDVNDDNLRIIQESQEELQYTMTYYIKYICQNYDDIENKLPEIFNIKREEASKVVPQRTAVMLAGLYMGYAIFMDFAIAEELITEQEKTANLEEAWKVLIEVGKNQENMLETKTPLEMIESAIETLTTTGRLSTVEYNSAQYMKTQDIQKSGFIGFCDEKENINLVYPDLLYKAVKKFYNEQGVEFPWSCTAMCQELYENGILYKTAKQERPQIRRKNPRSKKEESFIGILQNKIYITCRYNDGGVIREK